MASINLWSAMTSLAATDKYLSDVAQQVIDQAKGGFGNELSLEVNEQGTWKIRVFNCFEGNHEVELTILASGNITAKRIESFSGIREERSISF